MALGIRGGRNDTDDNEESPADYEPSDLDDIPEDDVDNMKEQSFEDRPDVVSNYKTDSKGHDTKEENKTDNEDPKQLHEYIHSNKINKKTIDNVSVKEDMPNVLIEAKLANMPTEANTVSADKKGSKEYNIFESESVDQTMNPENDASIINGDILSNEQHPSKCTGIVGSPKDGAVGSNKHESSSIEEPHDSTDQLRRSIHIKLSLTDSTMIVGIDFLEHRLHISFIHKLL